MFSYQSFILTSFVNACYFYDFPGLTFRKLNEEYHIIEKTTKYLLPDFNPSEKTILVVRYFQTFLFPLLAPVCEKDLYVK